MARGGGDPVDLLLLGALAYVGYNAALKGSFGSELQKLALSLRGSGGSGGWPRCSGPYGDIITMQNANANVTMQLQDWQAARSAKGENPYDWAAFRAHERAIGAPDPGSLPPREFCEGFGGNAG